MSDDRTRGRKFQEQPHPYRSDYQRDRDRVIHTKAFRRLEKKTQVFATDYSDHFRNRLTHTLEVSQITRTISQALSLNTDLCEVLALSHDIGHPPYSHEGERVLDEIMREHGEGFEHNLHALRIVEDFEEKYPGFRGLNLSFEVREGIIKHSRDYDVDAKPYVDVSDYLLGLRPPLEAQLIDVADEIAYNSADLDDGYDSGLLTLPEMLEGVSICREYWAEVSDLFPAAEEKLKVREVIRRIINHLASRLIRHTEKTLRDLEISSVEEVRRWPSRLVLFDPETAALNWEIKQFLRVRLYEHEDLKHARERAQQQIADLFSFYLENPRNLPADHLARVPELGVHRVTCDYIAGMTDLYAASKHGEIFPDKV